MTTSTTMAIRVTAETKKRLGQLARETRRSLSFLAAEAVDRYLYGEEVIIDGIMRGRTDLAAGRLVSNDAAFAELTAAIAAAGTERDRWHDPYSGRVTHSITSRISWSLLRPTIQSRQLGVVDRLPKAAAQLEDFATGRPGRVAGTDEKSVTSLPTSLPTKSFRSTPAKSSLFCE